MPKTLRPIKSVKIVRDTIANLEDSSVVIPKGQLVRPINSDIIKLGDGKRTFAQLSDQSK